MRREFRGTRAEVVEQLNSTLRVIVNSQKRKYAGNTRLLIGQANLSEWRVGKILARPVRNPIGCLESLFEIFEHSFWVEVNGYAPLVGDYKSMYLDDLVLKAEDDYVIVSLVLTPHSFRKAA